MKKVLLTGATGFIGRHALSRLLKRGYEVHAITSQNCENLNSNVHWHKLNLLDFKSSADLISTIRPTHLLHFAWYTVHGKYSSSPENVKWIQASLVLLQSFIQMGGQRIVMAGTCFEYCSNFGFCSEFKTPLKPDTFYGTVKHSLQMILRSLAREVGVSSAWGRIFFLYGPHEHPDRLVSSVTRSLIKGEEAPCSHGNQIRDFLFVEDVADAFVSLLESKVEGPVNIASGRPVLLREMLDLIGQEIGRPELIKMNAIVAPKREPPVLIGEVRRLKEEVGWEPNFNLINGILHTISWWKNQLIGLDKK